MTGLQTLNGSRRLASTPTYGDPFTLISRDVDRMIGSILVVALRHRPRAPNRPKRG